MCQISEKISAKRSIKDNTMKMYLHEIHQLALLLTNAKYTTPEFLCSCDDAQAENELLEASLSATNTWCHKNITIEVFNDFTKELEECWVEFEKKSNHYFFQSFIWQKTWYQQQKKYQKKVINYSIIVKNINEIVMIIPLNIDYSFGIKKLCWSGFPFSDYNAPLIKKNYDIKQDFFLIIWEKIINSNKDFDCICFDNLPEKILNFYNPFFKFLKKKN